MCTCSNNSMNNGSGGHSSNCGSNCFSLGPFRGAQPGCTPPNTGSIIPFSSGTIPVALATLVNGLVGLPWQIGFGTAVIGVALLGETLDLNGVVTEAFSVPRAGNITAISASFTETAGATVAGTATVTARVFRAPAGSTTFTATNAVVNLAPSFSGVISAGQTAFASANVAPIPVAQGDRLLMVYTLAGTGITLAQAITGTASAGITIS